MKMLGLENAAHGASSWDSPEAQEQEVRGLGEQKALRLKRGRCRLGKRDPGAFSTTRDALVLLCQKQD